MSEAINSNEFMCELVLDIARMIVNDPAAVCIEVREIRDSTNLILNVAPSDIGKMLGREGRTVRCLRTIVFAAARKLQKSYTLEVQKLDPEPTLDE